MEVFGSEWASAWQASINADPAYRRAGRHWSGAVLLRAWTGPDRRDVGAVLAELEGGVCLEARPAVAGDRDRARIVVGAPVSTWTRVLAGEMDPVLGLVRGRLILEKGSLAGLVAHARGARALLTTAARLDAAMPGVPTAARPLAPSPGSDRGTPSARSPAAAASNPPAAPTSNPSAAPASGPPAAARSGGPPRTTASPHRFRSTTVGLDATALPMRLWQKAKKLGTWDPADISLERDRHDWEALDDLEQDVLLRLAALFQAGEEAVTLDLLPLMQVVAAEGRLEESLFLSSFLWEEAKHVEAFRRFIDDVVGDPGDLERYATPAYRRVFENELPTALGALASDPSPAAQARASVTYNMIVEGVLAETGYHGYERILSDHGILPGMQETIRLVKRDESRHIAYGLFLLSRLVAEHGDGVRDVIEAEMSRLLDPALDVVSEVFDAYPSMPFGLELAAFTAFGLDQFRHRLERLEIAWAGGGLAVDA